MTPVEAIEFIRMGALIFSIGVIVLALWAVISEDQ